MELKKLLVAVLVAVILVVVAGIVINKTSVREEIGGPAAGTNPESGAGTRAAAPENIVVPEKGATVAANVATPSVVGPAGPNTSASFRSFDIKAEGGKFMPDTVIVNEKDVVHLNITAVDKEYDFTQPDYGFKVVIPKGQTKPVEFGATAAGKFTFYCTSCGGPEEGPVGYVVVAK